MAQSVFKSPSEIRVVLLCCDGLYQRDLMRRISEVFSLQAVVLQVDGSRRASIRERLWRYCSPRKLARYAAARLLRPGYEKRARPVIEALFYEDGQPPGFPPNVPIIRVTNVNGAATEAAFEFHCPDVVCVSGTQLIRRALRERAKRYP